MPYGARTLQQAYGLAGQVDHRPLTVVWVTACVPSPKGKTAPSDLADFAAVCMSPEMALNCHYGERPAWQLSGVQQSRFP
jgi:hypothetical protein